MNAITLVDRQTLSVELPNWLQECLIDYEKTDSDRITERQQDNNLVCRAFNFAYQLHEGQYRKSGEPYIAHPIAVAGLLRDLGGDSATIAAGFLHDVVEDTDVTPEDIEEMFGAQVRGLVEAVTKLSKFNFSSKTERQAENFRRMFLAMAQDIRVIVVKLADRLHNMRTLEHLKPERQQSIALETREIFAPLANRLGIWRFKWELEDLCFKYLEPEAYRQIQALVSEKRGDRQAVLDSAIATLHERITATGVEVLEIKGRSKHLYGIYHKMQSQKKEFDQIFDLTAIRIIVNTREECYRALAIVHDRFKPIPGRFKDYIGLPKPNRYQSLHTTVVGSNGRPLEVQIRTLEMHRIAEYGIAAHWKYKETGGANAVQLNSEDEKFTWLRQLLEWQQELKDAQEYVESIKCNLFEDDVYVFTPKGDVVVLAKNATPVDFAYHIHTEVGHQMKGARINGRWSVLDTILQNGDMVEIVTQKNGHPSLDWLNFVVTPSARNRIRQWFKRSHRDENIAQARAFLEKELGKKGLDSLLKSELMQNIAKQSNYINVDDLLAGLGYGEVTVNQVVKKIREAIAKEQKLQEENVETLAIPNLSTSAPTKTGSEEKSSPILGIEGLLHYRAGCCQPLPGESIIGLVTRGSKGIAIHRQGCPNVENIPTERWIPVSWNQAMINNNNSRPLTYPVNIQIETIDRVGVFKDILDRLCHQNINVIKADVKTSFSKPALISLTVEVRDRSQLDQSFDRIKNMSDILNIRRLSEIDGEKEQVSPTN
jgi:GTP diphosphokinase / guanosine-3',5'-bis(diphosphate) 3'-diphosphatase